MRFRALQPVLYVTILYDVIVRLYVVLHCLPKVISAIFDILSYPIPLFPSYEYCTTIEYSNLYANIALHRILLPKLIKCISRFQKLHLN